ncbi:DUF2550 domain-containing protein [Actinomadura livida]|uniref:DUF2550 domain-containing protein n=1 Tax=Actinomadura livida TaxID=79909 RepID=A0A7W7IIA8_9ACTN|nr:MULTISPECIES: DUF2550 domain-containing protein [Actinomadura]MBB4777641.1 hypothetical protein [Actinomadura catellatispora]GGT99674.1 hypothetical protein GCM10010208_24340 [Actinomadura livida]
MDGHLALDAGGVLVALILVAALLFFSMAVRRRLFARGGGAVECSLRVLDPEGGAPGVWRLGIGRYRGDALHWHRVFEFRSRPRQVIHRRGLVVSNRRLPDPEEAEGLLPDVSIIEVRDGDLTVELAMGAAALTGFLSWLEAAPPGTPVELHPPDEAG